MRLASCSVALVIIASLAGCKSEEGKAFIGNWIEDSNSKTPAKITISEDKSGDNHLFAVKITDLIWDKETGIHYNTKKIKAMANKEHFLSAYNGDNFIIFDDRLIYNGDRYKRVE
ncbi:TPA: hypothetical protein I4G64_14535 [Enterobacter cloacae]|nr:hypothetical protein [Enterobacter pasteurii]